MTSEIRYARSGEYHIAFRVDGDGSEGIDVLRVGAYVFSLALGLPPPVRAMEAAYAALGRAISFDGRGMGLSDRLRDRRLPPIEERMKRGAHLEVGRAWPAQGSGAEEGPAEVCGPAACCARCRTR